MAERTVQDAAANLPAEICGRFETAKKLADADRQTIVEITRQTLASFNSAPDTNGGS